MRARVNQDITLIVVVSHDGHEVERGVAPSGDATASRCSRREVTTCKPATPCGDARVNGASEPTEGLFESRSAGQMLRSREAATSEQNAVRCLPAHRIC
jgi:hypothetical protein